ncbi:MAG TPA: fumarylacetoacetate hydrolase family protein [Hyphomonadaceae bacterium]|nr:fumarylacetoacetate hydrolase family protein [Hyphomonadaceae bacterium]HPN05374.1 fumarylacetoacetate hydrolase family protein [Hyphomonadaceae bacterium]
MRLCVFEATSGSGVGLILGDEVVDLRKTAPQLSPNPVDILAAGPAGIEAIERAAKTAPRLALKDVKLKCPVGRPGKILGIGLNYHDHAKETGREAPTTQMWFNKQASCIHGPFDPVLMPAVSKALDYEVELVVVIGKRGRHVPKERAHEIIAGYMTGCDYSVRDWQRATQTMIMGKGFDTHGPVGPWITTPDEAGDVSKMSLKCWVNGELRQNGNTSEMIFDVPSQIEHLTKAFALEPGDLLFTGTPAGVGAAHTPPKFLNVGDAVRVEVERLGAIEAVITQEVAQTRIG